MTLNRQAILLGVFLVIWLLLAIEPLYRQDWLLENMLVFIAVPWLIWNYRRWRFSNFAYGCLFVFFTLHIIGAHYTYSEVPYDRWFPMLASDRNHYDRMVHFAYGLLIAPACVELLDRRAPPQGHWRWLLPVLFICSHSVIYEMIEWAAASVFGGELGTAYLGTQGDQWDAQKDMFLAAVGAAIGVSATRLSRSLTAAC